MGLGTVDVVLLTLSLLASAAIGVYYSVKGRRSTPLEYLLGGRNMRPLPLAMSMMVGTVSAITIMGNAGEMYAYGTQLWLMDVGIVFGLLLIAKVFLPIMHPLQMVSLYQYVEKRFKSRILRQATVVLQLVGGYVFIGFLLFPPSVALERFTALPMLYNILIIGASCTLYSTFGGVKAVVYADTLQSLVMVGGVLAIVIQGSLAQGGLDKVWEIAYIRDRVEFFNFSLDPYQRHSFWLCIILGFYFTVGTFGVNQSQTQRYFSTCDVRQAQWVLYYAAIALITLRAFIHLSGLVMFAHYRDCDPMQQNDPSAVIVFYVLQELSKIQGLSGLFVAAVYAAVLSSVSTQLNSMTALLWEDFLKTLQIFKDWTEVRIGFLQKIIVFCSGVLGIFLGIGVSQLGKSFLITVFAINGALSGPLIGLFFVAMLLPWINTKGATVGFILSIVFSLVLALGQLTLPKAPYLPLSRENCTTPTVTANTTTPEVPMPEEHPGDWLFGLSYCLNPLWGSLLCVFIGLLVSAATGFNTPEDLDEALIAPKAWRLFQRSLTLQAKELVHRKILRRQSPLKGETEKSGGEPDAKDPLNSPTEVKGTKDCDGVKGVV